ncbi:hypothetical protein TNCV_3460621 [Trichonephila clavipes]|nr:hypothetical protein TNCV_3460621 [Trichonephila clavipes]
MSFDYAACEKSLECLFGLSALEKNKFQEQFSVFRAQMPPTEEGTKRQNHIVASTFMVTRYKVAPAPRECSWSALAISNPQLHLKEKI